MPDDVSPQGSSSERLKILDMLADGKLTPGQAADLLAALGQADLVEEIEVGPAVGPADDFDVAEAFDMESDELASAAPAFEADTGGADRPADRPVGEAAQEYAGSSRAPGEAPSGAEQKSSSNPAPTDLRKWQRWWTLPLSIGGLAVILSGWLLFLGVQREWGWFWMGCLWLPLFLGILLTMLGWLSRTSRWIHVRVDTGEDEWPRHIAISLPLPIRLIVWFLRTFGTHIPKMRGMDVEMILEQVTSALSPEEPLYIEVDEGSGKEKVQIYIG